MKGLKFLYKEMHGFRYCFVLSVLFVAIETFFEVIIPMLMADIIDIGIVNRDTDVFLQTGLEMIVCAILSLVFGLLYARYAAKTSSKLAQKLRDDQYNAIQRYAFQNLDHFEVSGLVTRLTSDVTVIQNSITNGIRPIVRGPSMLIFGLLMSFLINAQMALVFFVVLPVLALILFLIVRKVAPMYSVLQKAVDQVNAIVQENLTAIRVVKAFVREDYEEEKFRKVNVDLANISSKTFHYALFNQPSFQLTMYAAIVILCFLGTQMIIAQKMQVGELTGILSYVLQIMNSLMMISNVFLLLTRSMASIQRVQQVLDENVEMLSGHRTTMESSDIVFDHVSFKYNVNAKENVLSNINLTIPQGSTLGILGGTGSAKTSLVQLIPRLYDATQGQVKIGSHDVKDYDLAFLRDQVGVVLQKNILFSGTVIDNLKWGNDNASMEDIRWACHIACVDEFIDRLDNGYLTDLGQAGINVSGGQKQRLCIARALLKHPKILIFDDSTSAVDTNTDAKIRQGLASITNLTQIIVAQRISSVQHCDRILILDDGNIAAIGTHAELLGSSPIYQELYASQQKGGEDHE